MSTLSLLSRGAIAASLAAIVAVSAPAAEARTGTYYKVELASPAPKPKVAVRDVVFQCAGTTCTAPRANTNARAICATAARNLGKLSAFTADEKSFDEKALATCNKD